MSITRFILFFVTTMLLASCATLSRNGVGRIRQYEITSNALPAEFDSLTIAFVSDIHYPSKFTRKRLGRMISKLRRLQPDMLMLGGDYVTSDEYINELFDSICAIQFPYGIYAVLGNHEFSRASKIEQAMHEKEIILLADEIYPIVVDSAEIYVIGVRNPFKIDKMSQHLSESVPDSAFKILLAHTPDYAQDTETSANLVLSGHTHGGQVSILGLYTPVKNTRYGTRFLRGLNYTDKGVPVITTNGVGTSRRKIRFCVPSEIVIINLFTEKQ